VRTAAVFGIVLAAIGLAPVFGVAVALMVLLAMRTHPPGTVVVPVTASQVVDRLAAEHGFALVRSRGNPRALAEAALRPRVVLVGEERGGFIFPAFQPAFDAMGAVVKLLEMMARLELRLHELVRAVPESHVTRGEVACPNERKGAVMRRLLAETRGQAVELVDGVRVRMGEEWVAAIPDPDRACFHVIGESADRDRARVLVEELKERIATWRGEGA
jgi:mannose-1-phosphate guanylyltransferase/phosphomannomutase